MSKTAALPFSELMVKTLRARISLAADLHKGEPDLQQPGLKWCNRCNERHPCLTRRILEGE